MSRTMIFMKCKPCWKLEEELENSDNESVMDQAEVIDESDDIQGRVIFGLGPQKTAHQKIYDWFDKMV